jgi:PHD/YefM family antitoxin component YafN of YafNO toxin-antitoxin module
MEYELAYVVRINGKGKGSVEYISAEEYEREGEGK